MGIKIDSEKIDSSLGVIRSFANDNVVDMIDQLATVMLPQAGTSELADKVIEQCKAAQRLYNEGGFLDTLNAVIKEFEKVIDVCLLYTSDAADDGESVYHGGRRIIKKKRV